MCVRVSIYLSIYLYISVYIYIYISVYIYIYIYIYKSIPQIARFKSSNLPGSGQIFQGSKFGQISQGLGKSPRVCVTSNLHKSSNLPGSGPFLPD